MKDRIKIGTALGSPVYVNRFTWERLKLARCENKTDTFIATNLIASEPRKDPHKHGKVLPFAYVKVDLDDKATVEKGQFHD